LYGITQTARVWEDVLLAMVAGACSVHLFLQGAMLSVRCAPSIYVYIHIYTCAYIYTHVHTYIWSTSLFSRGYALSEVRAYYICIYTYIHMCIHTCGLHFCLECAMLSVRCAHIMCIHTYAKMYTHIYTNVHTYIGRTSLSAGCYALSEVRA